MAYQRKCNDWLTSYWMYAQDSYCPDSFHNWTGISVLSGALERKVYLSVTDSVPTYPNTFILLVGKPGTGKSTAIKRGIRFIERLRKEANAEFRIMSGLATQAGLMSEMKVWSQYTMGTEVIPYWSCYYYASEASDSGLQNLSGDFNSTITALYDCDDFYRKTLKSERIDVPNPCFNLLAGSTFDFLKTVVNQNSVMGGLASRFSYVVSDETGPKSGAGMLGGSNYKADHKLAEDLYADLVHIHGLRGKFHVERVASQIYYDWWDKFVDDFKKLNSERMESIMIRKPMLLQKIAMIMSVSNSDSLGITSQHMSKAIEMVDEVTKGNADIISSAIIANKDTQDAVSQFIMQTIKRCDGYMPLVELKKKFLGFGGDLNKYDLTMKMLAESDSIKYHSSQHGIILVELTCDPNANL